MQLQNQEVPGGSWELAAPGAAWLAGIGLHRPNRMSIFNIINSNVFRKLQNGSPTRWISNIFLCRIGSELAISQLAFLVWLKQPWGCQFCCPVVFLNQPKPMPLVPGERPMKSRGGLSLWLGAKKTGVFKCDDVLDQSYWRNPHNQWWSPMTTANDLVTKVLGKSYASRHIICWGVQSAQDKSWASQPHSNCQGNAAILLKHLEIVGFTVRLPLEALCWCWFDSSKSEQDPATQMQTSFGCKYMKLHSWHMTVVVLNIIEQWMTSACIDFLKKHVPSNMPTLVLVPIL